MLLRRWDGPYNSERGVPPLLMLPILWPHRHDSATRPTATVNNDPDDDDDDEAVVLGVVLVGRNVA